MMRETNILALAVLVACPVLAGDLIEEARLPLEYVDTTTPAAPLNRTLRVGNGGDFQAALEAVKPGERIVLEAGAIYEGPFVLPRKQGSGWIVIETSAGEQLPKTGQRVDPSYAAHMPKLVSSAGPVIRTSPGAHHYRFVGIEISAQSHTSRWASLDTILAMVRSTVSESKTRVNELVSLSSRARTFDDLAHHIIFDRCYLHAGETAVRRGIAMNSRYTAVVDSWLSGFRIVGYDSQAIAGWNGPGPFKIVNNFLEGAGENVMFGGADPLIEDLVPSDIEIRRNHFSKPMSWKIGHPEYQGTPWTVKNLFELKNARRVLIDGNLFEFSWPHGQSGFAVLFTVRNQEGKAPWSVVEDVTFSNNVVRHVGEGINILASDDNHVSRSSRRIVIRNNIFEDVGWQWGRGRFIQLLDGAETIIIDHNTALHAENIILAEGRPHRGFVFTNNIVMHEGYGITGTGTGKGHPTLDHYFREVVMRNNVIVGGPASLYPSGNFFPDTISEVGFSDWENGDYRIASPVRNGPVNETPGVDFQALCSAVAEPGQFRYCRD